MSTEGARAQISKYLTTGYNFLEKIRKGFSDTVDKFADEALCLIK